MLFIGFSYGSLLRLHTSHSLLLYRGLPILKFFFFLLNQYLMFTLLWPYKYCYSWALINAVTLFPFFYSFLGGFFECIMASVFSSLVFYIPITNLWFSSQTEVYIPSQYVKNMVIFLFPLFLSLDCKFSCGSSFMFAWCIILYIENCFSWEFWRCCSRLSSFLLHVWNSVHSSFW